jgi:hypothetical protein
MKARAICRAAAIVDGKIALPAGDSPECEHRRGRQARDVWRRGGAVTRIQKAFTD